MARQLGQGGGVPPRARAAKPRAAAPLMRPQSKPPKKKGGKRKLLIGLVVVPLLALGGVVLAGKLDRWPAAWTDKALEPLPERWRASHCPRTKVSIGTGLGTTCSK